MLRQPSHSSQSLKWFWLLAFLLLLVGFFSGYFWSTHFSGQLNPALQSLKTLATQIKANQSVWHTFSSIFFHNLIAALFMIVFGAAAGIFPAMMIWLNGLLMGFVTYITVAKVHVAAWKVIVFGLLPHGVFELTALLWATALGLQTGFAAVHGLWGWVKRGLTNQAAPAFRSISFRSELRRSLVALPYIVILLVVAAAIESTITPYLIHWSGISG